MKRFILISLVLSSLVIGCKKADAEPAEKPVSKADVSYAFGVAIGRTIKSTNVEIDYKEFLKAITDVIEGKKTKFTEEDANAKIQSAIMDAMAKVGETNLAKEKDFLDKNGKKNGVTTTASGLQYEVITKGSGKLPAATDTVKVDYVGTLLDGTKFDSSIDRGEPAVFALDAVIPGWSEAIQLMPVGSKYKLYIPSALGYGEYGTGGDIGPNATLVFEVDLLSIEAADAATTVGE